MTALLKQPDTVVLHEEKDDNGETLMVLAVSPIGLRSIEGHLAASKDMPRIKLIKLCLHYIKIFANIGYEVYIATVPGLEKFGATLGFSVIDRSEDIVRYIWTGRKR